MNDSYIGVDVTSQAAYSPLEGSYILGYKRDLIMAFVSTFRHTESE